MRLACGEELFYFCRGLRSSAVTDFQASRINEHASSFSTRWPKSSIGFTSFAGALGGLSSTLVNPSVMHAANCVWSA